MMRIARLSARGKWALLAGVVGVVSCNREKATPQPEPAVSNAPAPIPSGSSSAGSQAQRAAWRMSANERFEALWKQCDEGAVKGCEDTLVLVLEAEHAYGAQPFGRPNVERVPAIARRGCDLGSKLACAFIKRAEVDKLEVRYDERWNAMVKDLCDTGGDPLCLSYRFGSTIDSSAWSPKACERGLGTECLTIVNSSGDDSIATDADRKRFAQKACDTYIQTCHDLVRSLLWEHPERKAWQEVRAIHERIASEQSKRCAEGHPTCGDAAYSMLELGRDFAETRRYAEAGLEDEDQLAAYVLGRLAEEGLGQPADPARAAKLYEKCGFITHDDEKFCHARLAALYEEGRGVPKDLKVALKHAQLGKHWGRPTPTVLRYFRLLREQLPSPPTDELVKKVKGNCFERLDQRCPMLWKLVEEGKPIPEALPER
ncbi:hypothetical protein [Polyangium sp. 15x6]|uniref:tetratricopeptide repeat protein n=1 Tax=Polyangium sp. 15x6 TaxID=3042687 RepID=UPI00249A6F7A|nr:hypothetical protein [Polyangium sp. 15x6]MDI3291578.1 hypothetical protein [Polyangium sp. 15x6]